VDWYWSNHRAFQYPITHQIQQWLEVFTAPDHPTRQSLAGDIDPMPT
jgi:hypothetical protein